ncbi:MAG: DUF2017 family protein [Thermoleophilia bacterium]|nr:DUF2017 family protein [Thermoleophilia bacterium]
MSVRRQLERARDGSIRLRLSSGERELLRDLAAELGERLGEGAGDPELRRLFPPAHEDDPDAEHGYRRLVGEELLAGRLEALRVLADTAGRGELTEAELDAWLRALNDLRLVLGTRLDVGEDAFADGLDPGDPDAPALALYGYLSWLQEQAVEAAAAGLAGGGPASG